MLPGSLRNRLARMILGSLHDPEARRGLRSVADVCTDPDELARLLDAPSRALRGGFEKEDGGLRLTHGFMQHAGDVRERARRAWGAIGHRPLDPPEAPLGVALGAAGVLFDAGLYYEVHEWLEPHWLRAEGSDRAALQGLIQVAVGFEHLANGNVSGARSLLANGCAKMMGGRLAGLDLDPFARAVGTCLDRLVARGATALREFELDRATVPRFPTEPDPRAAPGARSGPVRQPEGERPR
jgi:hypothetical protein